MHTYLLSVMLYLTVGRTVNNIYFNYRWFFYFGNIIVFYKTVKLLTDIAISI